MEYLKAVFIWLLGGVWRDFEYRHQQGGGLAVPPMPTRTRRPILPGPPSGRPTQRAPNLCGQPAGHCKYCKIIWGKE